MTWLQECICTPQWARWATSAFCYLMGFGAGAMMVYHRMRAR